MCSSLLASVLSSEVLADSRSKRQLPGRMFLEGTEFLSSAIITLADMEVPESERGTQGLESWAVVSLEASTELGWE